jgi:phosphocarrier protein
MSLEKELTIRNKMGMHARPAAQFVKRAGKYQCDIWVEKDDESVNGKSIMGLMMLAAGQGSKLRFSVRGKDAAALLGEMEALFARKFDES